MSRINLDNIKTYHNADLSDNYEVLSKFGRFFEKGFHDSQLNPLPVSIENIKHFIICTDGSSRYLADFAHSLVPFFLKVPFEINTNFRLPSYASEDTLILLISSHQKSEELLSVTKDLEIRNLPAINLTPSGEFQNYPHTMGYLLGLFSRLNPSFSKTLNTSEIFSTIEKTTDKLNRDIGESQNPAKQLAQKHSQKAVILLSSGHLQGVSLAISGLVIHWSKSFSNSYSLPEANGIFEELFTYPTKVLAEYQVIILNSDLYPHLISNNLEKAKNILSQKRINFSLIKPESNSWFEQILESLVFLSFFSYYLSIVNKAKN